MLLSPDRAFRQRKIITNISNNTRTSLVLAPAAEFGARAPTFRLLFGVTARPLDPPPARSEELIGLAWLYALHARSSIARGKLWQAEYMISCLRDQVMALACLRHGLAVRQAPGHNTSPGGGFETLGSPLLPSLE